MDEGAFGRYAQRMGSALAPALKGSVSGLFCDSWEVETTRIWTTGLGEAFKRSYGYDIDPYMDSIYSKANFDERYDYMKLVSEYVVNRFYKSFAAECHSLGTFSRVQCAGDIQGWGPWILDQAKRVRSIPGLCPVVRLAPGLSGTLP